MNINIFFSLLFFVSVFSYSTEMTDTYILPKWLYTLCTLAVVGIIGSLGYLTNNKKKVEEKKLFAFIVFISFFQSIYALFQIASLSLVQMTGSFDNPAGLVACLCTGIPCNLYFLKNNDVKKRTKWVVSGNLLLIVIVLFLSGSRAGILSAIFVFTCWKYRLLKMRYFRWSVIVLGIGLLIGMYFVKKDSADGRLLILQCGWEMLKEHPIIGHGTNGVAAHYMDYQAKWLSEHPDSHFGMLADNVKHVFNEYLAVGIRYGLLGILVLVGFIFLMIYNYRKYPSEEGWCALLSFVGIGILACFSYPLTYPFTWLVLILDVYVLLQRSFSFSIAFPCKEVRYVMTACLLTIFCFLLTKVVLRIDAEFKWCKAALVISSDKEEKSFSDYQKLLPILGDEPYFLYNYAMELYIARHYEEALKLAVRCSSYWADYDLELLQGDIMHKLGKYEESEKHYLLAYRMCPVRFIPLYRLYSLYKENGELEKANKMGTKILGKPIKVNSVMIQSIQRQVKKDLKRI